MSQTGELLDIASPATNDEEQYRGEEQRKVGCEKA